MGRAADSLPGWAAAQAAPAARSGRRTPRGVVLHAACQEF